MPVSRETNGRVHIYYTCESVHFSTAFGMVLIVYGVFWLFDLGNAQHGANIITGHFIHGHYVELIAHVI